MTDSKVEKLNDLLNCVRTYLASGRFEPDNKIQRDLKKAFYVYMDETPRSQCDTWVQCPTGEHSWARANSSVFKGLYCVQCGMVRLSSENESL